MINRWDKSHAIFLYDPKGYIAKLLKTNFSFALENRKSCTNLCRTGRNGWPRLWPIVGWKGAISPRRTTL